MKEPLHHTRLLLGLEIRPPGDGLVHRLLDRADAEHLGHALAADLARVIPEATGSLLTLSAGLLDMTDLIRPGFPAHTGIEQLAEAAMNQQGFEPRVLSIGASGGRMPHPDLMPRQQTPQGLFLAMPLLVSAPTESGRSLENLAEQKLFEHGGLGPPGLQIITRTTGLEPVHGQMLTLHDLMALQQVQLEGAGMDASWKVLESVLVEPDKPFETRSAEGLKMAWDPVDGQVELEFLTPRDWLSDRAGDLVHYPFWLRAARRYPALLTAHGLACRWCHGTGRIVQEGPAAWLETEDEGPYSDGLTRHVMGELGVVAWTRAHGGRLIHYYPLNQQAVDHLKARLEATSSIPVRPAQPPACDTETGKLIPHRDFHGRKEIRH